ncbi:hypothetical protein ACJ41O_006013 [Fusarium nematophilum]
MRRCWLPALVIIANISSSAAVGRSSVEPWVSNDVTSVEPTSTLEPNSDTTPPVNPEVIERCFAEELSPARATRLLIVLALVSALHMPGSLLFKKRSRFYRLAPEVGLIDLVIVLTSILRGVTVHRRSPREAVTSVLLLRYFTSKEDLWWDKPECKSANGYSPASAAASCYEFSRQCLDYIQTFGPARVIYNVLALTAVVEAFAVKGSITVNLMAATYAVPWFTLEIISLAALRFGSHRSVPERNLEAMNYASLIMEAQQETQISSSEDYWQRLYSTLQAAIYLTFGIPAFLNLFYPISVVVFILFTFSETHSANGKWWFSWLTWFGWLFWFGVGASSLGLLLCLPGWVLKKPFPGLAERYSEVRDRMVSSTVEFVFSERPGYVFLADAYTSLKVTLILRYFIFEYTGQGTVRPEWLAWLG